MQGPFLIYRGPLVLDGQGFFLLLLVHQLPLLGPVGHLGQPPLQGRGSLPLALDVLQLDEHRLVQLLDDAQRRRSGRLTVSLGLVRLLLVGLCKVFFEEGWTLPADTTPPRTA